MNTEMRLKLALARLTDSFLEKHGCFPLDNAKWKAAMTEAYALIGQPNTPARTAALAEISSEPATGPFMVPVEVDKEYVANAVVGFVENGYSQWCSEFKPDETHAPTCAILQTLRERKANIWYSEVQFWTAGGQAVAVFDDPSEDEGSMTGRKVVDLEVLHQGLRLMSEKSPRHFADLVNENDDADTHDTFAQYAILGDVVYG